MGLIISEPISSTVATVATTGAVVAAPVFGVDPMLVIGAITGAGVFILSHEEQSVLKKLILFIGSVACGFVAAGTAADVVAAFIPADVEISEGVGAIAASAVSVRVLQRALRLIDSASPIQDLLKGRRP